MIYLDFNIRDSFARVYKAIDSIKDSTRSLDVLFMAFDQAPFPFWLQRLTPGRQSLQTLRLNGAYLTLAGVDKDAPVTHALMAQLAPRKQPDISQYEQSGTTAIHGQVHIKHAKKDHVQSFESQEWIIKTAMDVYIAGVIIGGADA